MQRRHFLSSSLAASAFALTNKAFGSLLVGSHQRNYRFDRTISREVLCNYLSRAICMEGLLNGRGDLNDNIRMLTHIGAKYIGRSICLWGGEANLLENFERAKTAASTSPRGRSGDDSRSLHLRDCHHRRWSRFPCRTGPLPLWDCRWRSGTSVTKPSSILRNSARAHGAEGRRSGCEPAGDPTLVLFPGGVLYRSRI